MRKQGYWLWAVIQVVAQTVMSAVDCVLRLFMCNSFGARSGSKALTKHAPWLRAVSRKVIPSHGRRKPEWVRQAVLSLAHQLPNAGYRTLAHTFNLQNSQHIDQHCQAISVSKSFVAQLVRQHKFKLQASLRQRGPRLEPIQTTWGMDLTGLPLVTGHSAPVLGLIDHGSRAVLVLQPVAAYNSLVLLGQLLIAMGTYGKPRAVRSDNDAVFKTPVFRAVLALLRVQQQFTALGSPWQNGRIERFWRTLKTELQTTAIYSQSRGQQIQTRMKFISIEAMRTLLNTFKSSYNHDRPHQSLKGQTPAMVWNDQVLKTRMKLKTKPEKQNRPKPPS